ncbi:HAD family hydrolase [Candidatus Enterococcus murrayae]|uniref:HAD family hydrolase n=1 Tax=Candidatus Enterococcus murrayae TaxID=2815321 RepID=A0ABS3HD76_9ENTE|nr:HAD family hydrolase [Enterococcus sp. MJM16]MBO0451407.1 HAD family hydrolase [Enterococcus sp. MJM16]
MIKAVVFDLDDTLYQQEVPFTKAIKKVFPQFIKEDLTDLFKLFRTISDHLYEQTKQKDAETVRALNYQRLSKAMEEIFRIQLTESLVDSFEAEYTQQLQQICLTDSLKSVLQDMAENYELGIITNGYTKRQNLKLNALEINKIIPFENILISENVGIEKPDRRLFDQMAQILKNEPKELLYIGDSYKNDVLGAKQAGWQTWWFNHQQRKIPKGGAEIYDKEIQHFDELAKELTLLFNLKKEC